jgi:hypothetical protein
VQGLRQAPKKKKDGDDVMNAEFTDSSNDKKCVSGKGVPFDMH